MKMKDIKSSIFNTINYIRGFHCMLNCNLYTAACAVNKEKIIIRSDGAFVNKVNKLAFVNW